MTQSRELGGLFKDQLILMKILVTQPMIEIFMDNEIPDLNSMKNIRNEFDKLIKDIEAFNKTQE